MRKNNQPTYRPDLLKVILDSTTASNLASINAQKPCKSTIVLDKDQVTAMRKASNRWQAYTTGNAYVLYLQSRTSSNSFRVQAYGSTPVDAVKRWYRGLDGNDKWKRQCVRVVAVYSCVNLRDSQAGDLLCGQPQSSYPY